jgi:hypothetical protein
MNRVSALITADCGRLTYRFDQIISFYNQKPLGRWAFRTTSTATPQTNLFDEISSVCGTRDLGAHVNVPEEFAAAYFEQRRDGRRGRR